MVLKSNFEKFTFLVFHPNPSVFSLSGQFQFQVRIMKKQQHSTNNSRDFGGKNSRKTSSSVPEQETMAGSIVKKYDDLIRCTNVLTEGIESGKFLFIFCELILPNILCFSKIWLWET